MPSQRSEPGLQELKANSDMTTLNRTVKWVGILMMGAGVLVLK